uniref:Calmodulin-like protein 86 transcription variant 1 n=1 Tax=Vitis amurensis TaxID=103351 RepID=A0A6B9WBW6_9ROSI|nr:calmodulin-like protein 86 transcription variant 1 [Vitis amurensis]
MTSNSISESTKPNIYPQDKDELQKCSVQDCQKMIGSFDSDGDGNISFDEFKEMMTKSSSKQRQQ